MKLGKISDTILDRSVFKLLGKRGEKTYKRPCLGQDAAKIDKILISTANATFPVYRVANNISAAGGKLSAINLSVMLDDKSREIRLKELIKEMDRQAAVVGAPIIGGHTSVTADVNKPIVSVTGIGDEIRSVSKAKPGDDIIATKWIGISGVREIVSKKKPEILERLPEHVIDKAITAEEDMLVAKEAQLVLNKDYAVNMHDVSEGGIFAALWDMAEYSNVGLEIDFRAIPVKQEIIEICELFNINPYLLDSMGCLLMTASNGCDIVNLLSESGIEATIIGKVTEGNNRIIHNLDEDRFLTLPEQDEIYRLF